MLIFNTSTDGWPTDGPSQQLSVNLIFTQKFTVQIISPRLRRLHSSSGYHYIISNTSTTASIDRPSLLRSAMLCCVFHLFFVYNSTQWLCYLVFGTNFMLLFSFEKIKERNEKYYYFDLFFLIITFFFRVFLCTSAPTRSQLPPAAAHSKHIYYNSSYSCST